MQKIRFLVPFVIFLTLFLVTGAICYIFYSKKISIEEEIVEIEKRIGIKESEVYQRAKTESAIIQKLYPKIGFVHSAYSVQLPQAAQGTGYLDPLKQIKDWLTKETSRVKKVANIKSQHQTEFGQYIGLEPEEQISKIKAILTALQSREINDAIAACRNFLNEAQNVFDENRRAELQYVGTQLSNIQTKANDLINQIQRNVAIYQDQINVKNPTRVQINKAREVMYDAHSLGVKLNETLTAVETTIAGKQKYILLPKIASSKAHNLAAQLLFLLHHNDIKFLKRVYKTGISKNTQFPDDEYNVGNLEYIALVADALINANNPRFNTNPYYLAGITLEQVIDSQDLTIRALLELNHMLKTKAELLWNMQNPKDPLTTAAQNKNDIELAKDENLRRITDSKSKCESKTEQLKNNSGELTDVKSDMEETLVQKMEGVWRGLIRPIVTAIAAHKERRDNLVAYFNKLKKIMKNSVESSESIIRPSQGDDGEIIYADRHNHLYNINLGKSDNIRPGMRFLVYTEIGGKGKVVKGMIEVLRMPKSHFAICGEVFKYADTKIEIGDKISNPLYRNRHFLKVALIGRFEPPNTAVSREQVKQYLQELGVTVMDEPSIATDIVILATSIDKLVVTTRKEKYYKEHFRVLAKPDEMVIKDLLIYFKDQ